MNEIGFVYIWRDRRDAKWYIGSHKGTPDDGYVCSHPGMKKEYKARAGDFKRRILEHVTTGDRADIYAAEERWLHMIKHEELGTKYYNVSRNVGATWWRKITTVPAVGNKISASKKGVGFSDEHKAALSKAQSRLKRSEESNRKRSETLKGQIGHMTGKTHSDKTKAKMSASHIGKKLSADHVAQITVRTSKTYIIERDDGSQEVINGLKAWCNANGVKYVTARKALENNTRLRIGVRTRSTK